ncbi:MAG: hypothetical protein ACK4VN_14155 [Bacteroidales bacterium]
MNAMLKKIGCLVVWVLFLVPVMGQGSTEVEVKGIGVNRSDALQDAMRNAVGEAIGVALVSETRVENFMVIQDAINTRSQGYIESYTVVRETPMRDNFEIVIRARVSLSPLKADIGLLAQSVGGIRFLVMYDDRHLSDEEKVLYEHAAERINEHLASRRYRYIDRRRFDQLKREALGIYQDSETNQETYVQRLGMMADAQFIIFINRINVQSRSEAFDTRTSSKVSVEVRAYDNCTAEGLGTIVLESDWKSAREAQATILTGIGEAISSDFDRLLGVFTGYIGDWINNGTPFELRFYSSGTFRDFRDLRRKIVNDPNFGGQIEVVAFNNYTKLNVTFRDRADDLAYRILDYADELPNFRDKLLDVKFIYGRQINFAPTHVEVPEMQLIRSGE